MKQKQVLILSGSPRKGGNSDQLCDAFLKGATDAGHRGEKFFLGEKTIGYCVGCGACTLNKRQLAGCAQKDDMNGLLEKMIQAEVIVMATPIYFYTMDGQMKTFIDRTCSRYTELNNKTFYFIMTAADSSPAAMDRALIEFQGFTSCLKNPKEKGVLRATGVWGKNEVEGTSFLQEAYRMGNKI